MGWPMMGFMRETAIRYSNQMVADILLGEDKFIKGLDSLAPGSKKSLSLWPILILC